MDAVVIKAEQLRNELVKLFNTDEIGFTTSETDFGVSCYLTVNGLKIRVSDHEATNSVRVEREIMFNYAKKTIKEMTYTVEQVAFPERFELSLCAKGQKPTHIIGGKFYIKSRI